MKFTFGATEWAVPVRPTALQGGTTLVWSRCEWQGVIKV